MENLNQREVRKIIDNEHLKLLSIFHYISGGITVAFSLFFIMYFFFISFLIRMVTTMDDYDTYNEVPPQVFKIIFLVFGLIGFFALLYGILQIVSGYFMKKRSNRIFSFVIGIISMLSIPWGTILGIMTVIVLSRESVKEQYDLNRSQIEALPPE